MNRRRPWHQRLLRRVAQQAPIKSLMVASPLIFTSAFNAFGGLIALFSGFLAVAFVFGSAAFASLALQLRRQTGLRIGSACGFAPNEDG